MNDWTDLRYFLEVARHGTLSAAAAALDVEPSTVGRRLASLEASLGARLFERSPRGYALSESGRRIFAEVEQLEAGVHGVARRVSNDERAVAGKVRLATTEGLAAEHLAPALPEFVRRHPRLELALVVSNQTTNLNRREAEVALRLVRPEGRNLVQKRVGSVDFGMYCAESYALRAGVPDGARGFGGHARIGHGGPLRELPEARWADEVASDATVVLRVDSLLVLASAVEAGVGIGVLPTGIARRRPGLRRIAVSSSPPERAIWAVYHSELQRSAPIRAVVAWLDAVLASSLGASALAAAR